MTADRSRLRHGRVTAARNPCGVDNRIKTIAAFVPFAEFNQPSFAAGEPGNPLVAQNGAYTRFEIHFNEAEFSTIAERRLEPGTQSA